MPEEPIAPVGKITFSNESGQSTAPTKPVGEITFDKVTDMSAFAPPKDDNTEAIIEELARTSRGGLKDSEKDVLRQMLTNPNITGEQAKRGIAAIQGYDEKQSEDNTFYYLKQEDNGVMVPQALAKGERPPEGYDVARVFSSPKDAKDDSWYTDVSKSIYNGVLAGAEGALSLAQQGTMAITDEESEYLNKLRNTADALKIYKDEDLNKPLFDSQGVKKVSDIFDKERYDISPQTIWGTLNMLTETVTAMAGGAAAAKALKAGNKVATFAGSYIAQLGDNLDAANEVGIEGRDAAALTSFQTGAMALMDAVGLEGKILGGGASKAKKELTKKLISQLPKNADGTLTREALAQLAKELPVEYAKIAKTGFKEFGKNVALETTTEAGQEFLRRASEQLWDKLSDEDKAKFGTDVTSPESFAAYMENGLSGLIGGVPMAAVANNRQKYNEQSTNVFNAVKQGESKIGELKSNLDVARDKGQITQEEYDRAVFKMDAYKVYNEQTADLDLNDEQKKEAFELSFNIEALKSEIPTKKEDIEGLDPIGQAKIAAKKELMNGLQKQLNDIILKKDVEKETKVAEETKTKTEPKEGEEGIDALLKKYGKTEKGATQATPKVAKPPRAKRSETDNITWAGLSALQKKQILQDEAKETPNNEIGITLIEGQNATIIGVLDDGKRVDFAQSVDKPNATTPNYFNRKSLPEEDPEGFVDEAGQKLKKYKGTVPVKRVEIESFEIDENGNEVPEFDDDGNRVRKAVLSAYNPESGEQLGFVRENSSYKGRYWKMDNYTPKEKAQLNKLAKINYLSDEILPFAYQPKGEATKSTEKQTQGTPTPTPKKLGKNIQAVEPQQGESQPDGSGVVQPKLTKREKELKEATKPKIELDYIANKDALVKQVSVDIVDSEGNTDTAELKAVKVQSDIKRRMELLKQVLDCIHG